MLPVPPCQGTPLASINIRKHCIELYVYVVGKVRELRKHAKEVHHGLPFVSFNIDLYRNKFSKTKYFASRFSFNIGRDRHSFNLGIRGFTPTYLQRTSMSASDLLTLWLKDVCEIFGLDIDADILSMSGDHGSDVASTMKKITNGLDEWCVSHLLDRAGRDAFGTSVDAAKSKNVSARDVITKVRKTLETVHKSEALSVAFTEQAIEQLGRAVSTKNEALHRWGTVEAVLECAIFSFAPMGTAFTIHMGGFPLANEKKVLVEFYSIVHEIRKVQKRSQAMHEFVVVEVFVKLIVLYFSVSQPSQPLLIHDPSPRIPQLGAPPPKQELRPVDELDPRTILVRRNLLTALSHRYYNRYNAFSALRNPNKFYGVRSKISFEDAARSDFKFSYLFDTVAALWPGMSDGVVSRKLVHAMPLSQSLLKKFTTGTGGWSETSIRSNHFNMIQNFVWSSIRNHALKVAVNLVLEKRANSIVVPPTPSTGITGTRKRRRRVDSVSEMNTLLGIGSDADDSDDNIDLEDVNDTDDVHAVAAKMVDAEIAAFKEIPKSACKDPTNFVKWWATSKDTENLRCLRVVASAYSGLKVGSGGLECDIGVMVDLVTPKRGSLGAGYVEALSFLKLNKQMMPFDPSVVEDLPKKSWTNYIPGSGSVPPFTVQDQGDADDLDGHGSDLEESDRNSSSSDSDLQ